MRKNNSTFIALGGIFILCIFSVVTAKNILPDSDNNHYYAKPNENMTAKIEEIIKEDNKLIIKVSGDPKEYCLKTTKSIPSQNAICWNTVENSKIEVSYFEYKKYYIWIKDKDNRISERVAINKNS